jgi:peptidoglycan/LPS O-acetylase OafA/YrhL
MQNLDRNYILLGLCWVIVGMALGIWLGITNQQNYGNSHAHVGLLGFVASVLFGLLHWAYPGLGKSRLAMWQFIVYQIGVVILVVGKFLVDGGKETVLLPVGAVITIVGAAMMLAMFAKHGHKTA